MGGSVLSFLKAEWKVSDTGSAQCWASSLFFLLLLPHRDRMSLCFKREDVHIQFVYAGKTPNSLVHSLKFYVINILIYFAPSCISSINYFRKGCFTWFYQYSICLHHFQNASYYQNFFQTGAYLTFQICFVCRINIETKTRSATIFG
jgi:hypothetical protein